MRVVGLGCALTFVLFFPGIIQQGAPAYRAATGLDQQPYLARWLLSCAGMFVASALVLRTSRIARSLRR